MTGGAGSARHQPVVGLVGGVGCGKSTVARLLGELGAAVIDADRLAHDVLAERACLLALRDRFGPGVFSPGGDLDRQALAERVFGAGAEDDREFLEGLVHPRVRERILASLAGERRRQRPAPLVVLDVPLLLESPLASECDRIVFVEAPRESRTGRAAARGWAEGELGRREEAQMPLDVKRGRADLVLDNDGELQDLQERVTRLFAILTGNPPPTADTPTD